MSPYSLGLSILKISTKAALKTYYAKYLDSQAQKNKYNSVAAMTSKFVSGFVTGIYREIDCQ